jgi:hypothetical protein
MCLGTNKDVFAAAYMQILAFVFGSIWVMEDALSMFLALHVFTNVTGTILKAVCTLSMSFAVFVLPLIDITVR